MKLNKLARSLALIGLGAQFTGLALAQDNGQASTDKPADTKLERVEVTGSSIKRVADQGALPLEVITANQIKQQGLNTAEDVLRSLGANAANADNAVSRNNVFGGEQDRLTGNGSFANLRGLGPTGTLVLLNGRRLSNQGLSGGAVDLNAIPMEMIDRIEVLKDGASAIYGTDAIGGVINFILKQQYQGLQMTGNYSTPTEWGGGQQRKVGVSGGYGDLDKNGFNIMGSVSYTDNIQLRGIDRPWATGYQPSMGLTADTTSSPMFANIIGSTGSALSTTGAFVNGSASKYTVLNALALTNNCSAAPFGISQLGNISVMSGLGYTATNSTYRCGTDYGRQYMLTSPARNLSGVLHSTIDLGKNATGWVEYVGSRAESLAEFTPYQFSSTSAPANLTGATVNATSNPVLAADLQALGVSLAGNGSNSIANYPVSGPYYAQTMALLSSLGVTGLNANAPIAYRLRMSDWGDRTIDNISFNNRFAVGVDGSLGDYDYKASLSHGEARAWSDMVNGYADTNKLAALLASGIYNPFLLPGQSQSAQAEQLIQQSEVHGKLFGGRTTVDEGVATISGPLIKLPAGDLDFALGGDLRREGYDFSGTQTYNCVSSFSAGNAALSNSVMGCPGNAAAPNMTRKIEAVFGEMIIPVFTNLELQAAIRYDHYQQIGGTTNPKIGFKFTPMKDLLFRGSYNTGFRAPTPQQLNLGTVTLATTGTLTDPVKCPNPSDPSAATNPACQLNSVPYTSGGNPNLKPEKSRQASLGVVFSPIKDMTASIDYWQIKMLDRIHNLTVSQELQNYSVFANNFIRDANGNITLINAGWINAGGSMTKGVDFTLQHSMNFLRGKLTTYGSFTKMISDKEALIDGTPFVQYVGQWTNNTLYLPWKGTISSTYKQGEMATTLSASYSSGYQDEDHTTFTTLPQFQHREVASYTTFNLISSYTGFKNLTLTGGFINLLNRQPPFTWHDVDNVVGAGWDPRVADPRGLTGTVSAKYVFF